jgi:hypothetical protein
VNLPGPALDFVLAQQHLAGDIAPEKLKFQPRSAALGAPQVASALDKSLWVVLEVDHHSRQVGRQLVERHGAVDIALLTLGAPDDALIRHLIHDLRRPGTVKPEDLCLPLDGLILLLFDVLDLLHETGEFLELCPRLVRHCARNREVKLFDNIDELHLVFALVTGIVTADGITHFVLDGGSSFQPAVFDGFDSSFERGLGR